MFRWIMQTVVVPVMLAVLGYLFVETQDLRAEVAAKKDNIEANREHSEIREAVLANEMLRNQPPEWFKDFEARLDMRLNRLERGQR